MQEKPVCIIPARGGSKRIPRKNIADFNGKPLIAWSIETALNSEIFSDVIVSTDSEEIAEIALQSGASIPFTRDAELADDFATTADVLVDALNRIPAADYGCCLYPTAPMVTVQNLQDAYEKVQQENVDCVVAVTEFDFHPLRAFSQNPETGNVRFNWPEHALTRSQDLPEMVHDAGAFYFFHTETFMKTGVLIAERIGSIELSRLQAVDIDTMDDFELARALHARQQVDRK